ncbi:MAG: hypothetical protein ACFFB2_06235 [Promethearchaeota archaeon]
MTGQIKATSETLTFKPNQKELTFQIGFQIRTRHCCGVIRKAGEKTLTNHIHELLESYNQIQIF